MPVGYDQNKAHHKSVTLEGQIADSEAAYDWLVSEGVSSDRIGAMGFCMGGRLAYLANAHRPLRAAISFTAAASHPIFRTTRDHSTDRCCFSGAVKMTSFPKSSTAPSPTLSTRQALRTTKSFFPQQDTLFSATRAPGYITPAQPMKRGR